MRSGARAELRAPSSRLLARLPSIVRFAHSAFAPFSYFPLFPNKGRYVTKKPLFRDDSGKRISLQVNTSRIMPGQGTVCANGCPFRTTRHLLICYKPLFSGNIAQMRDGDRVDAHEKGKRGEEGRKEQMKGDGRERKREGKRNDAGPMTAIFAIAVLKRAAERYNEPCKCSFTLAFSGRLVPSLAIVRGWRFCHALGC